MAREPVVPGRMERVQGGPEDPRCVVDYAHTPEAVDAALAALRPSTPGRLVVVLGAGGDRDTLKRSAMGAAGARWADDLIVTDDNPRSEDPATIREQVLAGARVVAPPGTEETPQARARSLFSSDAGRAAHIARAVALARAQGRAADNTVVVLGKGHETGQDIGGIVHPFDDRDALAAALRGQPYRPEAEA
jgi:UDP-N-acetylmuramoyl-L-alanyl-D-glutamate--2,6-diaminopimelate ligase